MKHFWKEETHIYRPQRSCGQGNVFTGVCLSTGGGEGVCLSASWDAIPPPRMEESPLDGEPPPPGTRQTPPDGGTPPGWRTPPGTRQTPPDGEPPRDQADPPRWRTPRDQADPPPGSRLQHTVYKRPVRILLECILVISIFCRIFFILA